MRSKIVYSITETEISVKKYLEKKGFSTQNITNLKHAENGIMLNGSRAYVNEPVKCGDVIEVNICECCSSPKIPPVNMKLDIVYEDDELIIINKPADMPTHPSMNNYENTLANGLAAYFKNRGEDFVFRSINRLDRNTTGAVLVAKHFVSGAMLSDMVKSHELYKEYVALVQGNISCDLGEAFTIDAPIARVPGSTIERRVDENGERAVTHVRVLERFKGATLVSCQLETGRTHQIRVHMSHIGYPLLGDGLYNPQNACDVMERQALHCTGFKFIQPITGKELEVRVPLPEDMQTAVCKYRLLSK